MVHEQNCFTSLENGTIVGPCRERRELGRGRYVVECVTQLRVVPEQTQTSGAALGRLCFVCVSNVGCVSHVRGARGVPPGHLPAAGGGGAGAPPAAVRCRRPPAVPPVCGRHPLQYSRRGGGLKGDVSGHPPCTREDHRPRACRVPRASRAPPLECYWREHARVPLQTKRGAPWIGGGARRAVRGALHLTN